MEEIQDLSKQIDLGNITFRYNGNTALQKQGKGLKIISPKQMLQRSPIALAQVKAGNTSKNLLNEIRQIISLYQEKEITKKVYNNMTNSIKL